MQDEIYLSDLCYFFLRLSFFHANQVTYSGGCLMGGELTLSRSSLSPLETEVLERCVCWGSHWCYGSVALICNDGRSCW